MNVANIEHTKLGSQVRSKPAILSFQGALSGEDVYSDPSLTRLFLGMTRAMT